MANIYDIEYRRQALLHRAVCDPRSADIISDLVQYLDRAESELLRLRGELTNAQEKCTTASGDYIKAERELKALREQMRQLLWTSHCGSTHISNLYGDDGEMQCARCGLDFKRQPLEELQKRCYEENMKRIHAAERALGPEGQEEKNGK